MVNVCALRCRGKENREKQFHRSEFRRKREERGTEWNELNADVESSVQKQHVVKVCWFLGVQRTRGVQPLVSFSLCSTLGGRKAALRCAREKREGTGQLLQISGKKQKQKNSNPRTRQTCSYVNGCAHRHAGWGSQSKNQRLHSHWTTSWTR